MENGHLYQAEQSIEIAVAEIQKYWDKGDERLSPEDIQKKRESIKKIVGSVMEYASVLAKLEVIAK